LSINSQKQGGDLAKDGQSEPGIVAAKRGVPIYQSNPSVPKQGSISRPRKRQIGDDHKGMVIDTGSGEVLGPGAAIAYEWEEVDSERFVKLFLTGLKQASGLSKSGLTIFEIVYHQVRQRPNDDRVELSYRIACNTIPNLADRTYNRGLRELLDKEFLFRSQADGVFFVNIRYMFNGDRLAFVKAYHLKGAAPQSRQLSLLPEDDAS
jgi:hypothetical protein